MTMMTSTTTNVEAAKQPGLKQLTFPSLPLRMSPCMEPPSKPHGEWQLTISMRLLKPLKLNNQSETLTAMKEKTGETMVMRCLVDCCFIGVVWCSQWLKWDAVACLHVVSQALHVWLRCDLMPKFRVPGVI
jgi:hypothetical protein